MSVIATERDVAAVPVERPGVMGKLEAMRREFDRCRSRLKLTRVLLAEIALAAALVLADWMWVLPTAVRGAGLLAMVGLAVWKLARSRRPIGREAAAAEVENHFPELGQRLRTVVEYAEPSPETVPASPGLVEALVRETDSRATGLEFGELIPWASVRRRAVALVCASVVALAALVFSPGLRTAVLRMLLIPAHYTSLAVKPGDATLNAGEEFALGVMLSGRPVDAASWSYRKTGDGDRWTTDSLATLRPAGKADRRLIGALSARLRDCQADFDYRVVAGDVESPVFHVRVVHPLVLKEIEATVTPPAYTRRPVATVKEGNLRAIEGSRVQLAVTLDRAPSTATLLWGHPGDPSRHSIPLRIDGPRLTGELPPILEGSSIRNRRGR